MKYTLYYAHAKLKAVKAKRLRGNTGIVHLSIVRWNLFQQKHLVTRRKENRQIVVQIFALNSIKIKQGKVPVTDVVFVINYFIRDQFTFLAKVNIRVKMFSACSLHLMENSMFVKHVT